MNYPYSSLSKYPLASAIIVLASMLPFSSVAQEDEEAASFELSPFQVDADENQGYRATNTLAGTRLRTELRDVGSAISVFTPEFLEDTGATDAETLLAYGLNTEVAGIHGNFADSVSATDGRVTTIDSRASLQNSQRIRGLASASLTRGYFLTDIPFDSYNTTRITINRGPNSLLFGIGEPGGVIDSSVKQASITESFGEVSVRIGQHESHRETFDYNQSVIAGRLGLRIAAINEETNYRQKPAFQDSRRIYLAADSILLGNEGSKFLGPLKLRGNIEVGSIDGTPPNPIPFSDALSPWFGLPDNLDQVVGITGVQPPGFAQNFTPKYTVDNRNGDITPEMLEQSGGPIEMPFFINMPYVYTDAHASAPSVGLADPSVAGVQGRVRWDVGGAVNVPDYIVGNSELYATEHYFGKNRAGPARAPGFAYPVIMDRNIYNNENVLLSGTTNRREQDFDVVSVALEQTFFDGDAGIELSYDKQDYENFSFLPFSDNQFQDVKIDISETLPNGQANPNVGRAFIMARGSENRLSQENERETARATAFYNLDLRDYGPDWLGRHVFTGVLSSFQLDTIARNYRNAFIDIGDTDVAAAMNDGVGGGRRAIPTQVYVTESLLGSEIQSVSDVRINKYFTGNVAKPGDVVKIQYNSFNPVFGTDTNRLLEDEFGVEQFLVGGDRSRREIDSKVLSWQGYLFEDHLVGLFGWRSDELTSTARVQPSTYQDRTGVSNYLFEDGSLDPGSLILGTEPEDSSSQSGDTITWSVVGHIPAHWVPLPLNSRLSLHYGESENFSASGVRHDFYGNIIPAPTGTTIEWGGTLSVLDDKLLVRLNFYETTNEFASIPNPGLSTPGWASDFGLTRYKQAELAGDTLAETLAKSTRAPEAAQHFNSYQEIYDAYLAVLPEPVRSRWEGFDAQGSPVFTPNPNETITRDFVSEGVELEVVGNLTRNWTFILNVAKQETVTSNTAPVARDFILKVQENVENSILANMIDSPVQEEATTSLERLNIRQLNPLVALLAKDGTVSQEQRKYRVNLISNYSFREGRLNGFGIGGALRWQSKAATGYEIEVDEEGIVTPLLDRPFYGPEELNGDIWVSYQRTILKDIDWKIQLNVRNLIRDDDYIPVVTNPDGRVAIVRNPNPMAIFVTNTFSF